MAEEPTKRASEPPKTRQSMPSPWLTPKLPTFMPDSSMVSDVVPSANYGDRRDGRQPDMIILHYTGMPDAEGALTRLCTPGSEVSAHYVVLTDGRVIQCVPERLRAWHAGVSSWHGDTDINSSSIGVEIVNPGHDWGYPDFPRRQIAGLIALCRGIMIRRELPVHRVLAHSDVAPGRKKDPGEKFPWDLLAQSGVGLWTEPASIAEGTKLSLGMSGPLVQALQDKLVKFGYGLAVNGNYDSPMMEVVAAFQRHFRPKKVDGIADASTLTTLDALLAKLVQK